MTLQEAHNFFESLATETTKKSEIKVYNKFMYVISELNTRNFTKEEIQAIETELETFDLKSNRKNNIKFFKKTLRKFENFLKDSFSLTLKGYYTKLGLGLGSSFGILFGVIFLASFDRSLGISIGLIIGMLLGLAIGKSLDTKAISKNKAL
jgi:hypothetical protein